MITREQAVEAAKQWDENSLTDTGHPADVMAEYILQSPPLAWDEKRCRDFVRKCFDGYLRLMAIGADDETDYKSAREALIAEFAAELASMPGGRVERKGDLTFFLRNVLSQGGAIQQDYANRPYEEHARRLDVASVERADELASILSGRGADDSGADELLKLRKILAHVPAKIAILAKEAAGYGDFVVPKKNLGIELNREGV